MKVQYDKRNKKDVFYFLFDILKGFRIPFLIGHVLTPVSRFLINLLVAALTGSIFSLSLSGNTYQLLKILFWFVPSFIFLTAIHIGGRWIYQTTVNRAICKFQNRLLFHVQNIPLQESQLRHSGEWISIFSNDISALEQFLSGTIANLLSPFIIGLGCLIAVFCSVWQIGLFSVFAVLAGQLVHLLFEKKQQENSRQCLQASSEMTSIQNDMLVGAVTIRVYEFFDGMAEKCKTAAKACFQSNMKQLNLNILHQSISGFMGGIVLLGPLILGVILMVKGIYSIAVIMFCIQLTGNIGWFFGSLASNIAAIQSSIVSFDRLVQIFSIPEENPVELSKEQNISSKPVIFSKNLSVRYPNGTLGLNKVSFSVNSGEKIAIIGESGCGKSTLLKAVMQFVNWEGELNILDVSLNSNLPNKLGDSIKYVPQDIQLFGDTILNNLTYWKEELFPMAKHVLKVVCMEDFINSLPQKESTVLQERGNNLSGGQRQRFALAKALIKEPSILLLDESTSALDALTENKIFENLKKEYPHMTILFVTHHPSTVSYADKVWVMQNGQIINCCTPEKL